mmetsp:Transcript_66898/g.116407  ORF Transcript_66898/g.116407 Transcript_66898/m.116407 type:complete len:878 (+) Transcript_66898:128-2761(+)
MSMMRLVLPLVLLQVPGLSSVRPEVEGDTLEVNAKGSLVHLKDQLENKAALAKGNASSGDLSGGERAGVQQSRAHEAGAHKAGDSEKLPGLTKKGSAKVTGVSKNRHDDMDSWIATMITSAIMALVCFLLFQMALAKWRHFPLLYANNTLNGLIPPDLKPDFGTLCGWVVGTREIGRDDSEAAIGLDNAFLIEFWKMSIEVVASMAVLYCTLFMLLHYCFGSEEQVLLGKLGMENLEARSLVFWAHCAGVWYVVLLVVETLMTWHEAFLERRTRWLHTMPAPRVTTVLVEEIPHHLRSDASLLNYFSELFGEDAIQSVFMVKHTEHLVALQEDWRKLQEKKLEAESTWEVSGSLPQGRPTCLSTDGTTGRGYKKRGVLRQTVDMISHYTSLMEDCSQQIATERLRIRREAEGESQETMTYASTMMQALGNAPTHVCTHAGFVTFKTRRDAAVARMVNCKQNLLELTTGNAPDPSDIKYEDFMVWERNRATWQIAGYFFIALLFFGFLPLVVFMQSLSNMNQYKNNIPAFAYICDQYPLVETLIQGVLSSLGLNFVNGFIPTILLMIFQSCFTLRAHAWAQATLQVWYFWFQIIYIILVTAIGKGLFETVWMCLHEPMGVPQLLANTLPSSTHFYLNFLSIRWGAHFLDLTRFVQVSKFVAFHVIYKDAEKARELSEPEDQDFYGSGSRSARSTISLLIPIIYGPLCPLILLVSLVDLILCRHTKGYLINFAETRKPDLGGVFWVQMMRQVFFGLFIYVILMFGVLHNRGPNLGGIDWLTPGTMILPVAMYLLVRYTDFLALQWDILPFEEAIKEETESACKIRKGMRDTYEQAELIEELEITYGEGPTGAASSSATFGPSDFKLAEEPAEDGDGEQT